MTPRLMLLLVAGAVALMPAGVSAETDPGWPRSYTTAQGAHIQVYQPQVESWVDQRHLVAYIAVAYQKPGAKATLGTMKVEADTSVALEQRLVSFSALKVAEAHFGSAGREEARRIVADVERAMPAFERVIALDRVLAGIDASQIRPKNVAGVKADPPQIFVSTKPAVLVNVDGPPIWSPIAGSDLTFAVNTNWDVFQQPSSGMLYLRHDYVWLKAATLTGPWLPAGVLPDSFGRLPADENWKAVRTSLPGRRIAAAEVPTMFVSTSPAELILLSGEPIYQRVSAQSSLLWVRNSESDVFRMGVNGPVYYLVAGRWFSASTFSGPWTFATPTLPSDFASIPPDHPRSRVLAAVPGTRQAAEAVVLAQIPQTATINRRNLQAPEVQYQGAPMFQPIDRTSVQRAANTDKDIIRVGDLYYMCFQGVWFVSSTPYGPWEVASTVPGAIYSIPPSSPSHHVTYVTVVDTTPETVVFAAGAGYTGVTIAWGCAVWGTGWYYPPYVWYGAAYPIYYPFYPTYGYAAVYNPWTGSYARGAVAYGPYGGVGAAARYDPSTGTYSRGAMAWGPYGANGVAQAYNPRTGGYGQTRQGSGVYGSWGSSYVQRGDDWAHTARATNNVTGNTARVTRTDDGGMVSRTGPGGNGFVAAGEEGVYAGRDGSVYRRAEGGGWQKYENGSWGETQRATASAPERAAPQSGSTLGQLERDRSARLDGTQRAQRGGGSGRANSGAGRPSGGRGGRGR